MHADLAIQCEMIIRVLCDIRPREAADAAYLYAQTRDNEESVLSAAQNVLEKSLARKIIVLDNPSNESYAGFLVWKGKLVESGIEENKIIGVKLCTDNHNTLTEAKTIVRFAKQHNYQRMIVSAAPFHQIRAFMTSVRVALAEYPKLKIYSVPGNALPWNEDVIHSQGRLAAKRSELIEAEFSRIDKYSKKGDLISFDKIINYLDQRDQPNNPKVSI